MVNTLIKMISNEILDQSWQRCWKNLASLNQLESLKEKLIIAYNEPHRKYHTITHLNDCLTLLNHNYSSAVNPTEIELALWFHDSIYDVHAVNNEEMSADFASKELMKVGLPKNRIEFINELILSTKHSAAPKYTDHMIISDIDLAILGTHRSRFIEYEAQIREEYEWVSEAVFQKNRINFLSSILEREHIYYSPHFRDKFESIARDNISYSINKIGQKIMEDSNNENRLNIWRALSDLFLDTEIDEVTYKYIARTIEESNFTVNEVENILWHEVYPVLESNLKDVAGVWAGWPDSWLLQHLKICIKQGVTQGDPAIIKEIKHCWSKVIDQLPRKY